MAPTAPRSTPLRASPLSRLWSRTTARLRGTPDLRRLCELGLSVGDDVYLGRNTYIDADFCHLVAIGDRTVISLRVIILAHDASTRRHIGYSRVAPVVIGDDVFIGAGAILLPGVTIGNRAIIGAGSVVRGDVPAGMVYAGNPAAMITSTESYLARASERLDRRPRWERRGWIASEASPESREAMRTALVDGEAFIR